MSKERINFWNELERPILALAPMVGITDSAFRQICRRWGADVVYSEMISADAIVHKAEKALHMFSHDSSEYPLVVQLMGKDPEVMTEAAKIVEASGASGIDINFGCPANKIAKNMCGVMLMRDLDRSREIIEATINAVKIPVSIKSRISIRGNQEQKAQGIDKITILDFIEKVSDLDIAAIMIHGRSFEGSFDGPIDTNVIRQVKRAFTRGPVLVNGGITSVESSRELLDVTGADGIGFARSAIGQPWIFEQVKEYLTTGTYQTYDWEKIASQIIEHVQLFEDSRGPIPFQDIRKHLTKYVRGHKSASKIRQSLVQSSSPADVQSTLKQFG